MSISRVGAMKLRVILYKWAEALRHEIHLHGAPNTFGVNELAKEYGLDRRDGYRLGTTRLLDLRVRLAMPGLELAYKDARFSVAEVLE